MQSYEKLKMRRNGSDKKMLTLHQLQPLVSASFSRRTKGKLSAVKTKRKITVIFLLVKNHGKNSIDNRCYERNR